MMILLEQLVYGSFPFWDRGYDVLAKSPGCRAEWAAELLAACRKYGDAPSGVTPAPAFFSIRLANGPRVIVGVQPQGSDDRGRPGALAFHALLVDPRDFRKVGSNPFAFANLIRHDWSAGTTLDALSWTVEPPTPACSPTDPRTRRLVGALAKGRRVALESAKPIDDLAREVWAGLPESTRRRASVATWAFGNANRFNLVALPRLAGVELDRSYLNPASIDFESETLTSFRHIFTNYRGLLAGATLAASVAAGWAWFGRGRPRPSPDAPMIRPIGPEATLDPRERARIVAGLQELADRLDVGGSNDPGDLMAAIAARYHFREPIIEPPELARLAAESDRDRDRALAWHERIKRTFVDDRPWPDDFAGLPLTLQLEWIARSFHLSPSIAPEAIPAALREALSRDAPIVPTPLAARYPPLTNYARFLGRLPRRSVGGSQ